MSDSRPPSIHEPSLSDKPSSGSIAAGIGALFGALIGGIIGFVIGGNVGAVIGAIIGAVIGGLFGRMLVRREKRTRTYAQGAAFDERQVPATHPGAPSGGGTYRSEADVSLSRRSDEATTSTSTQPAWDRVDRSGAVNLTLVAEKLEVSKRELEAGLVRLRKIVKTEVVQVPVELRREEIVVERVEPGGAHSNDTGVTSSELIEHSVDNNDEIVIRLVKEEPVIQKEAKVFSEVHVHKVIRTETENIRETVRHEDVKMDRGSTV